MAIGNLWQLISPLAIQTANHRTHCTQRTIFKGTQIGKVLESRNNSDVIPVCRMLQHPANRTHNPQLHTRPATWKTTAQNTTRSNHCIILLSSWWWAWCCPKHVEQAIRSAIKTSVASSWHFISTYSKYWGSLPTLQTKLNMNNVLQYLLMKGHS